MNKIDEFLKRNRKRNKHLWENDKYLIIYKKMVGILGYGFSKE